MTFPVWYESYAAFAIINALRPSSNVTLGFLLFLTVSTKSLNWSLYAWAYLSIKKWWIGSLDLVYESEYVSTEPMP